MVPKMTSYVLFFLVVLIFKKVEPLSYCRVRKRGLIVVVLISINKITSSQSYGLSNFSAKIGTSYVTS